VTDGGVVLRSGATINAGRFASFFVDDRSVFQLTMYGDLTSIIGRAVVAFDQTNTPVACGIITQTDA
jgi:hypothetical protein